MIQHPDTPTSQFTAVRWTFYRRLGLLLRTRLQGDGTTFSLHDVASRTGGRVSAEELIALLAQGARACPDAITCILLAHAFNVDPDYFMTDSAVEAYVRELRAHGNAGTRHGHLSRSPELAGATGTRMPANA